MWIKSTSAIAPHTNLEKDRRDLDKTNWCNGFIIQFRQCFVKETCSYDEHLKS